MADADRLGRNSCYCRCPCTVLGGWSYRCSQSAASHTTFWWPAIGLCVVISADCLPDITEHESEVGVELPTSVHALTLIEVCERVVYSVLSTLSWQVDKLMLIRRRLSVMWPFVPSGHATFAHYAWVLWWGLFAFRVEPGAATRKCHTRWRQAGWAQYIFTHLQATWLHGG